MAKTKVVKDGKCKVVRTVSVVHVQVDVCDNGKLHGARVTLTDANDHDKQVVQEFNTVAKALDDVFFMLLKTKIREGLDKVLLSGPVGNA